MFTSIILLLIPFLLVTFLPLTLKAFSSDELEQMGIHLEGSEMEPSSEPIQGSKHIHSTATVVCLNA